MWLCHATKIFGATKIFLTCLFTAEQKAQELPLLCVFVLQT